MNIRQVFTKEIQKGEEPDFFTYCPHCAGLMTEKEEAQVIRK